MNLLTSLKQFFAQTKQIIAPNPNFEEAKRKLEYRGYYVSNFGLITRRQDDKYAIGEILNRYSQNGERVIVSYPLSKDEKESKENLRAAKNLLGVLEQEKIWYNNRTDASVPNPQYDAGHK